MSDVQKKDVLQQNDANPIPIGQYTISKMLGIKTVDISPKYNSEKVYSKLFEELKGKELDAYQEKYRFYQKKYQFDNEKYFLLTGFVNYWMMQLKNYLNHKSAKYLRILLTKIYTDFLCS